MRKWLRHLPQNKSIWWTDVSLLLFGTWKHMFRAYCLILKIDGICWFNEYLTHALAFYIQFCKIEKSINCCLTRAYIMHNENCIGSHPIRHNVSYRFQCFHIKVDGENEIQSVGNSIQLIRLTKIKKMRFRLYTELLWLNEKSIFKSILIAVCHDGKCNSYWMW